LLITYEKGTKGKEDKIILVDGNRISYQELAGWAIDCCDNRVFNEQDRDTFLYFFHECIEVQKISEELYEKYEPSQEEIDVVVIALLLFRIEDKNYWKNSGGEMMVNFLHDCMWQGEVSEDICEEYGLKYRDF